MNATAWTIRVVIWTATAAVLVGASYVAERLVPGRWGEVALCALAAFLAAGALLLPEVVLESLRRRAREEVTAAPGPLRGESELTEWGTPDLAPERAAELLRLVAAARGKR